jgi:hypothetical protein
VPEIKLKSPSMEERIANRLCNSGEGANPDTTVKKGESPNRVFHKAPAARLAVATKGTSDE